MSDPSQEELLRRMRHWRDTILPGTMDFIHSLPRGTFQKELGAEALIATRTSQKEFLEDPTVERLELYVEAMIPFRNALLSLGMEGLPDWVGPMDLEDPGEPDCFLKPGQPVRVIARDSARPIPGGWGRIVRPAKDWADERYVVKVLSTHEKEVGLDGNLRPLEVDEFTDARREDVEPISEEDLAVALVLDG